MKTDEFRAAPGASIRLARRPTHVRPMYQSKAEYQKLLQQQIDELSDLQSRLYAHDRYAVLLIFQAMDAAGKDSAIKHVMSGVNPQGCQVFSFKHPSAQELDHDFLWRTTRDLPERGRIGIFNRSYYEEVLIVRVHPEILQSQSLPDGVTDVKFWKHRYQSIIDLETHLHRNGTRIVKFFLHVSKEEQRQRFIKRIDDPAKNWKFSAADIAERELWDKYMEAYEHCIAATSTRSCPWYVVPADDKKNAQLIIATVIVETMKSLKLHYPELTAEHLQELRNIRKALAKKKS
jgi:PPK2 family polyphosphate:nucleotide phosphotransferase